MSGNIKTNSVKSDLDLIYKLDFSACIVEYEEQRFLVRKAPFRWIDVSSLPKTLLCRLKSGITLRQIFKEFSIPTITILYIIRRLHNANMLCDDVLDCAPSDNIDSYLFFLQITGECNLNCEYCYNQKSIRGQSMNFDTVVKSTEFIRRICNLSKPFYIHFHGGEPLTNWDVLQKSILYIRNLFSDNCHISLSTNGVLLTQGRADFLKKNKVEIKLSFDGISEAHDLLRHYSNGSGSAFQVIKALDYLEGYKDFTILTTLTRHNVTRIKEILDLYVSKKVPAAIFRPFYLMGQAQDRSLEITPRQYVEVLTFFLNNVEFLTNSGVNIKNITKRLLPFLTKGTLQDSNAKRQCSAYTSSFFISIQGDISGCDLLPLENKYIIGNVENNEISSCRQLKCVDICNHTQERCRCCPWQNICGGGCAAMKLINPIKQDLFNCSVNKLFYPAMLSYVNKNPSIFKEYFFKFNRRY